MVSVTVAVTTVGCLLLVAGGFMLATGEPALTLVYVGAAVICFQIARNE